jgi:hypothetical protein
MIGRLYITQRKDPLPLWQGIHLMPGKPKMRHIHSLISSQNRTRQYTLEISQERRGQIVDETCRSIDAIRIMSKDEILKPQSDPLLFTDLATT